jgi:hypothetical protein
VEATGAHGRGLPCGKTWRGLVVIAEPYIKHSALAPEPVACAKRRGPTPFHPEPGRETRQRRRYWRLDRWETRSVRHSHRGVEQWQLVGLITRRSMVRIHPPLPVSKTSSATVISTVELEVLSIRLRLV